MSLVKKYPKEIKQIMAKYPEFTDIADPYSKTTTGGGKGK